jgi:hypothetical protein
MIPVSLSACGASGAVRPPMKPNLPRPEERCRGDDVRTWCDTVPACFRSEAFAEDLAEAVAADASAMSPVRPLGPASATRFDLFRPAGWRPQFR